ELPNIDIEGYESQVNFNKVKTRPSYLNAIMIQSRGRLGKTCLQYSRDPTRGPFPEYRRAPGHFEGSYGNCKWRDHGARYTVRNPEEQKETSKMAFPK